MSSGKFQESSFFVKMRSWCFFDFFFKKFFSRLASIWGFSRSLDTNPAAIFGGGSRPARYGRKEMTGKNEKWSEMDLNCDVEENGLQIRVQRAKLHTVHSKFRVI